MLAAGLPARILIPSPIVENPGMGLIRDLLLALNRNGRSVSGSAAFPEPPRLTVPQGRKDAVDREDREDRESNGKVGGD